jgi:sigma-B regulation protein RsbU (phosphoserine phosphatase)
MPAVPGAVPLLRALKRRVLWRVRRKLTISYIFIGVVPAMLIVVFFLLCGLLLFFNAGSYMVRTDAAALVDAARLRAQLAAAGGAPAHSSQPVVAGASQSIVAGADVPMWVPRGEDAALLVALDASEPPRLAARGVSWLEGPPPARALLVDLPFTAGIDGGGAPDPARPLEWVAFLEVTDWATGQAAPVAVPFRVDLGEVYRRIAGGPLVRIGAFDFGQFLLVLVAAVGGLFLVIQVGALAMGLGLARTITGAIHDLFAGTARIRQGDFTHRIPIHRRDQLGELAESFNAMTASVEDLLRQKAEKERLEQELRIARTIQMSLLPHGPVRMAGLSLTGYCEPAREVGGDYYDFLRIDDRRLGILIADVAGKGTSAAFYMAELKGLMLSLSLRHLSPRALLLDANRILSQQLDRCTFITMSYLVIDLEARTLAYARAGHSPLIYLPALPGAPGARTLTPDGLVLGLQIDNGEMFERLLEEVTLPIARGDLFVLYTDGLTDAVNEAGEWFGDDRLVALVEQHASLPFDELGERILGQVHAFAGAAPQHDDMTMVLVRVE